MEQYKQDFIDFMVDAGVLRFGSFVTKSGRQTPFFINAGLYRTGSQLKKLGEFYARAMHESFGEDFDVVFGPAYKGIPLAVSASMALYDLFGKEVGYCANRKEEKDHGDVGILLGTPLKDGDRVLMIEDVTTSGKSIRETMPILKAQADVQVKGLCVSVDRMERGTGEKSAIAELEEAYDMKVRAIVTMAEIVEYLYNRPHKGRVIIDDALKAQIDAYYEKYGV